MKKGLTTLLVFITCIITAQQPDDSWLEGSWGITFPVFGGARLNAEVNRGHDAVAGAQEIVDELPEVGHVITNLSYFAHSHYFTLSQNNYVDIRNEIHPDFVPSAANDQIIFDVLEIFKKADKKVILYISTNYFNRAEDDNPTMKTNWDNYVAQHTGGQNDAYVELLRGFVEVLKDYADGYWLDTVGAGVVDIVDMIQEVDPTAIVTTNQGKEYIRYDDGTKLWVDTNGESITGETSTRTNYNIIRHVADNCKYTQDFTNGHVTSIGKAPTDSWGYEEFTVGDMIENPWTEHSGKPSIKHGWFPVRYRWHTSTTDLFYDTERSYRTVKSIIDAGASVTLANTVNYSTGRMMADEMVMMKEVNRRLAMNNPPDCEAYTRPAGARLVGENFVPVNGINITENNISLDPGDTKLLNSTVTPSNASTSKVIIWSTSDASVATVNSNGQVTAIGSGTATIRGRTLYEGYVDTCKVTVSGENGNEEEDPNTDPEADGDNLALNGTASQSSNHPNGGGEAYRANDGDTGGRYNGESVTRTNNEENPWWQVELETEYSIDTINVFGRTDACCNTKLSNFDIIVLDANGNITFTKNFTEAPNPSLTINAGGITGQTIKIQQFSDGIVLNLAEVEVYGSEIIIVDPPLDSANLALRGIAYQSSNHPDGGGEAYRANDGDTGGRYNDESVTRTNNEENPWWQVVLETPADIETIKIFNRTDSCCSSRLSNFTVFIGDGSGKWVYNETFTTIPDPSFTISDIGVYGRTIRIQTHESSVLNLAEVEVYGAEVSTCDEFSIIEAENYDSMSEVTIESSTDTSGGQQIGFIENGDWILFENLDLSCANSINARISSKNEGGNIEVRLDGVSGTLIGTILVPTTGSWTKYETVSNAVSSVNGTHDVYLKFTGGNGYLFNLNWIEFSTSEFETTETITPEENETIGPWNISELREVPNWKTTTVEAADGMTGILYESIDYLDNKVEVFAYYSAPSGTPPTGGWPAAIFAHGGGGTAYPQVVKYWNDKGYAAISMDLEGQYPNDEKTPNPGPKRVGTWDDYQLPIEEQWYYHAVAQVLKAHSLIASFPEVNADKIGVLGASWGGTITSTVMGVDNRLAWALPVYGAGFLSESDGHQGDAIRTQAEADFINTYYDGSIYFDNVTFPTLWLNGTNDHHFSLSCNQLSSREVNGPTTLMYIKGFAHGDLTWRHRDEVSVFANSVVNGGIPLPQVEKPYINSNTAYVSFSSEVSISSTSKLFYTTDGDNVDLNDKTWESINATISGNTASASVPANATLIFFRITDSRELSVTTEYLSTSAANKNLDINEGALLVYPNPVEDQFTISLESGKTAEYIISDTTGKTVLTGTVNDGISTVNVNGLTTGLYIIQVSNNSEIHTGKLVKN